MTILDRFRIDDRVAIVTGASSGLGVAFAAALRIAQPRRQAIAGELRGVLLAGEPGIGKTRLAAELAAVEGFLEGLEKQTAEQSGQHPHREKEIGPARDPTLAVG